MGVGGRRMIGLVGEDDEEGEREREEREGGGWGIFY